MVPDLSVPGDHADDCRNALGLDEGHLEVEGLVVAGPGHGGRHQQAVADLQVVQRLAVVAAEEVGLPDLGTVFVKKAFFTLYFKYYVKPFNGQF